MVFGADKKLVPSMDPNHLDQTSGTFKNVNSYGMMMNAAPGNQNQQENTTEGIEATGSSSLELNKQGGTTGNVLEAAQHIEKGKHQLKQIINILEEDRQ